MENGQPSIPVPEVAERLGIHKATCHKLVKRLSIQTTTMQDPQRGNQKTSCITAEDFNRIEAECRAKGLGVFAGEETDHIGEPEEGHFYLIQLEPQHDPGRFKVGYSGNVDYRLQQHKCSAPFAVVVKSWRCKKRLGTGSD